MHYAFATDVFLENLWTFQKQPPEMFYEKICSYKILQYSQESCRPATLFKRYSNTDVFQRNLKKFYKNTYFEEIC